MSRRVLALVLFSVLAQVGALSGPAQAELLELGPDEMVTLRVFDFEIHLGADDLGQAGFWNSKRNKGTHWSLIYALHDTDVANCLEREFAAEAVLHHPELIRIGAKFYDDGFNRTPDPAPFLGRFERAALKHVDFVLWLMPPNSPPVTKSDAYACDRRPAEHATVHPGSPFPFAEKDRALFYVLPPSTNGPEGLRTPVVRCAWNISETMCTACLLSEDNRVAVEMTWPQVRYPFASWPDLLATFREIASVLMPSYAGSLQ